MKKLNKENIINEIKKKFIADNNGIEFKEKTANEETFLNEDKAKDFLIDEIISGSKNERYKLDDNTVVWRYMDIWKFYGLMSGNLYIPRCDAFEDKFEGMALINEVNKEISKLQNTVKSIKEIVNMTMDTIEVVNSKGRFGLDAEVSALKEGGVLELGQRLDNNIRHLNGEKKVLKKVLDIQKRICGISCWHINENESDAMWKIFSSLDEGIMIKSTIGKIKKCLVLDNEIEFIGFFKVNYYDEYNDVDEIEESDEQNQVEEIRNPFLEKRNSFSHEREARGIFLMKNENSYTEFSKNGCNIGIKEESLNELIEDIKFAPNMEKWKCDILTDIIKNAKLGIVPQKSGLYDEVRFGEA